MHSSIRASGSPTTPVGQHLQHLGVLDAKRISQQRRHRRGGQGAQAKAGHGHRLPCPHAERLLRPFAVGDVAREAAQRARAQTKPALRGSRTPCVLQLETRATAVQDAVETGEHRAELCHAGGGAPAGVQVAGADARAAGEARSRLPALAAEPVPRR
jgi:hypothetical protein